MSCSRSTSSQNSLVGWIGMQNELFPLLTVPTSTILPAVPASLGSEDRNPHPWGRDASMTHRSKHPRKVTHESQSAEESLLCGSVTDFNSWEKIAAGRISTQPSNLHPLDSILYSPSIPLNVWKTYDYGSCVSYSADFFKDEVVAD